MTRINPTEQEESCIFCHFVSRRTPAQILFEDETTLAFLDNTAVMEGHTLVIPKRHTPDMWAVTQDEAMAVMRTAHRMAHLLRCAIPMHGMTMFQANGPAGWQDVFHLHLHLVPRLEDDHLSRPWHVDMKDPAILSATREKILASQSTGGRTSPDS
jgi:histidine triad (HIT) family protein